MINFTNSLYARMNEGLQRLAIGSENDVQRAEQSYRTVQVALAELKEFIQGYTFKEEQEEIRFFKEIKPLFLKELVYFVELFYVEAFKPVGSREKQRTYLLQTMDRIALFFNRHQFLYTYYRMGHTHLDHLFFLRDGNTVPLWPGYSLEIDPQFSTVHSYKLSKLQAYEALRDYVQGLLYSLDGSPSLPEQEGKGHAVTWTDSKAALIELAYALQSRGAVNFGKSDVKALITGLEQFFDVRLGNFYRVYQGMRIRKKSRTPFLDTLRESLERRMDEADQA